MLKKWSAIVLAAATVLLCTLLCLSAVRISRMAPEGIRGVFTPERISEAWASVRWALWLWLTAACVSLLAHTRMPAATAAHGASPAAAPASKHVRTARLALAVFAAALLIAGVLDGTWRDVLVKAINICTECVGLG